MRTELWLVVSLLAACTHTENLIASSDADASAPLDASERNDGGIERNDAGIVVTFDAGIPKCNNRPCECSDTLDNDGDEWFDGFDPECTGAADDSESDFGTGKENNAKCQDCFFDDKGGGKGPFSDGCERPLECSTNPSARVNGNSCGECAVEQSSECVMNCQPVTPNGCDCFGCCSVFKNGTIYNVLLRSSCSMATLGTPACTSCVPSADCNNPCEDCELCPGRTSVSPSCSSNRPVCSGTTSCMTSNQCAGSDYCLQGCCVPVPSI
jgi:hypothetical protein